VIVKKRASYEARVVQETVDASADDVYAFAATMENLPRWASGLAAGVSQENGEWFTESPMGRVRVAMAPPNAFRVRDHDVTLPNGLVVHNAFRVTPAGDGSLLTFVVLRMPDTTSEAFEKDVAHVASDLKALKAILEQAGRPRRSRQRAPLGARSTKQKGP
jgi:Polyketide cyclase / dehydrase and lipid transport